jgi:hypothetical protein
MKQVNNQKLNDLKKAIKKKRYTICSSDSKLRASNKKYSKVENLRKYTPEQIEALRGVF